MSGYPGAPYPGAQGGTGTSVGEVAGGGYPQAGPPGGGYPQPGSPSGRSPQAGAPAGGYPQNGAPGGGYPQGGPPGGGYPQAGAPSGGYPQACAPSGGNPQAGAPGGGYPQAGAPGGGYPQASAPIGAYSQNGAPSGGNSQTCAPGGGYPQAGAPGGVNLQFGAPGGGHPQAGAPTGGNPQAGAPGGGYPHAGAPGGINLQSGAPGGGYPPGRAAQYSDNPVTQVDPNVAQWFEAVDQNNNGHIDSEELSQALVNGDMSNFSQEACQMMIKMFDSNLTGTIEINEFGQLFAYIQQWKAMFEGFDKDRNGRLDPGEFTQALQQMGYRFSPVFIQNLLTKLSPRECKLTLDNFILVLVQIRRLTDSFRTRDTQMAGAATLQYEDFVGLAMGAHN